MLEALHRETLEETGMRLKKIRWAMVQDCINSREFHRPGEHFLLINFFAESTSRKFKLNDEAERGIWIKPREALKLKLNRPTRKLLDYYFKRIHSPESHF